jgi:hypothetical protein
MGGAWGNTKCAFTLDTTWTLLGHYLDTNRPLTLAQECSAGYGRGVPVPGIRAQARYRARARLHACASDMYIIEAEGHREASSRQRRASV